MCTAAFLVFRFYIRVSLGCSVFGFRTASTGCLQAFQRDSDASVKVFRFSGLAVPGGQTLIRMSLCPPLTKRLHVYYPVDQNYPFFHKKGIHNFFDYPGLLGTIMGTNSIMIVHIDP